MRVILILVASIAGCGHSVDKTAEQFCTGVQIALQTPSIMLDVARQSVTYGRCTELNEASHELASTIVTFQAAALPFRDRPEVGRTLDAIDKLPLKEVHVLHCYRNDSNPKPGEPSQAEIEALIPKIDQVLSKLAAVNAACRAG